MSKESGIDGRKASYRQQIEAIERKLGSGNIGSEKHMAKLVWYLEVLKYRLENGHRHRSGWWDSPSDLPIILQRTNPQRGWRNADTPQGILELLGHKPTT